MVTHITLLSRLNPPNIGHTLMHAGVEQILAAALEPGSYTVEHVEQHFPLRRLYAPGNPIRLVEALPAMMPRGYGYSIAERLKDVIADDAMSRFLWRFLDEGVAESDLAIACGGPSLIGGMSRIGQIKLMMHHLHGALSSVGVPVLNLGVGSCYPWPSDLQEIPGEQDRECAVKYVDYSTTTTVRDRYAYTLLAAAGRRCPLIPCPAFAFYPDEIAPAPHGFVLINFMNAWPLTEPAQAIQYHPDVRVWSNTVRQLIPRLAKHRRVVMACHNQKEVGLAREIAPEAERVVPRTTEDYRKLAAGAVAGLTCRIHAAIPLASAGVPSIVIGSDTRVATTEEMGLPAVHVSEASLDCVETRLHDLIARHGQEKERLKELKAETIARYAGIVRDTVRRDGPALAR